MPFRQVAEGPGKVTGLATGALGGPICNRFASRSAGPSLSDGRFFSFSEASLAASAFCACRRASLSLRSFSFLRALDSNSCQSPSSAASLSIVRGNYENGPANLLYCLFGSWLLRCKVRVLQNIRSGWSLDWIVLEHCFQKLVCGWSDLLFVFLCETICPPRCWS